MGIDLLFLNAEEWRIAKAYSGRRDLCRHT